MPTGAEQKTRTAAAQGILRVMERLNPYEFRVRVEIMREGLNNNRWDYRNLKEHYKTFMGQPILIAYVGQKVGDGHNMREVIAPDGGRVYTFMDGTAERIIGVLGNEDADFTLEMRDGKLWVVANGKIFTFYAREAVEKIIATGAMDVSAETDVFESEEGPDGTEIFTNWAGLGVTILGDDVPPAIPGARIKQLAQLREDMDGLRLHAASLLQTDKEKQQTPKTKTEKGVKTIMNKRELAQLQAKFDGYTAIGASDDGRRVVLMRNEDCAFCGYTFADDGVVVPERIRVMRGITTFIFGESEDEKVSLDSGACVDEISAKLIRANADNEDKAKKITALEGEIDTMRKNERIRRIDAAKEAVCRKFADMNAVRNECFDAALRDGVCSVCEEGKFCEDVDGEGKWCGDKNAVDMLLARCMDAQTEMDKKEARKRANSFNALTDALYGGSDSTASGEEGTLAWLDKQCK